jgi:cytochrome c
MAGVGDAGDAEAGAKIFQKCHACHNIGPDAKNAVAPVLNGIDGRHSGVYPGYAYSDANKNSGLTWDEATFKDYIVAPQKKIPGTKMTFPGLPVEADRDNIWAYISQFKADGSK